MNEITNTETNETVSMIAFDMTTVDGQKTLFNALNSAESLNSAGVDTLTFDGILIRPSVRTDAITGESVPCKAVTFIANGKAYYSTSNGIVSSAENLVAALGGVFPAGESITVNFKTRDLGRGRTMKYFEWA